MKSEYERYEVACSELATTLREAKASATRRPLLKEMWVRYQTLDWSRKHYIASLDAFVEDFQKDLDRLAKRTKTSMSSLLGTALVMIVNMQKEE